MFALYGVRMGQVSVSECSIMIDHCFSGTFYSDLSGVPKTKLVKGLFMRVMNMTEKNLNYFCLKNPSGSMCRKIKSNLERQYPEWFAFLMRMKEVDDFSKFLHKELTIIEKEVMDGVKEELEKRGFSIEHLKRVHDALYGLEDIDDIEKILKMVVNKMV